MNSNNTVMIKMKSIQTIDDEANEMELFTEGTYDCTDQKYTIKYEDSEATGYAGSSTTIELDGNIASINRIGKSNSNLIIEVGKKHFCHYETPFGDMMVGIYTHKIQNELNLSGGYLYMRYTIDINSSYISDNEIIMNIEKI